MLMKTPYKTAKELDLTDDQYEGLVRTLDLLRHTPSQSFSNEIAYNLFKLKGHAFFFSMTYWNFKWAGCNTAHCLGGTADHLMGKKLWKMDAVEDSCSENLHRLFYPSHVQEAFAATPTQAADALEYYLTTGEEAWKMVMDGK